LSAAEGFQVVAAAQAVRRGWSLERLKQRVKEVAEQTDIFFTLDTLHYLQKGGRIGRVQAMAGALLNLKPVITVDKEPGTYVRAGNARSIPKALLIIADLVKEKMKDHPAWIHVLHTNAVEAAQNLAEQITARLPNAKITLGQIVPVLGVHTGPGCVGAVCGPLDVLDE
jgi:DegV family protein with EDD domain